MATVVEVLVRCDVIGLGYRVVAVEQDKKTMWAFVWGNIRAHVGDCLPVMESCSRHEGRLWVETPSGYSPSRSV